MNVGVERKDQTASSIDFFAAFRDWPCAAPMIRCESTDDAQPSVDRQVVRSALSAVTTTSIKAPPRDRHTDRCA